jgi:tellurite resistance protein
MIDTHYIHSILVQDLVGISITISRHSGVVMNEIKEEMVKRVKSVQKLLGFPSIDS